MHETWDLSFLIDSSSTIHDARGMTGQYLGVEVRHLPGRLFVDFVDPTNRGAFRRRLVKLVAGTLKAAVRVRLMTCQDGVQEFFALLKESKTEDKWWLMLAMATRAQPEVPLVEDKVELAEGQDFMMLVEGAARQLNGEVDLMQVRAAILTEVGAAASTASPEARERLANEFDEIVVESAYDNIATRPQPGEYLMLKDRAKPAEEVLDKLEAAAERMAIPAAELGLASKSVPMEALAGDFSQANINGFVYDLRRDPNRPVKEWELEPEPRSWLKPILHGAAAAFRGILPSAGSRSAKTDQ
jgi:hypothetical protein